MSESKKKTVRLKEEFWTPDIPGEEPRLIGSQCDNCGELFFPKKEKGWCVQCQKSSLKDIHLSRVGKIISYSVVMQQPGGGFYHGEIPYAYGQVELPEGIRIITLFAADDFDDLEVGKNVKLVIDKLCEDDEGNEVVTFKFAPVH
jgi:uncharacterized OB-fold protein